MYVQALFVDQYLGMFIAQLNRRDIDWFGEAMRTGAVTPVIDRRHPFVQAAEAIRHLETGRARGKVVVTME
jgi:NADPH:quinone reductase-like Zn-dependent oxidoreductase